MLIFSKWRIYIVRRHRHSGSFANFGSCAFFVVAPALNPTVLSMKSNLHQISHEGFCGSSSAHRLLLYLDTQTREQQHCFLLKMIPVLIRLLLKWFINIISFLVLYFQHNYTLLWACLQKVTAAGNMFCQHVYQNCLVYFNSSQQTCQRFLRLWPAFSGTDLSTSASTSPPERGIWHIMLDLKNDLHLWGKDKLNYCCNSVSVIISVQIWQQSWGRETERVMMREKRGERCRCGGKERRESRGGRHAWESCGRCLKALNADDEKRLSHFLTRFPGLPPLPFPSLSHWVCPHLPTHSSLSKSPCLRLRCSARVTPQHCSVISGPGAASSQPTNWT